MARPDIITRDHDVLGGTPVFATTRVPVQTLLDSLAAGQSIQEFLDDFPTVTHSQAVGIIEELKRLLLPA